MQNLCDGKLSLISGTDKLAAVLRKRHQILRLNEHDEPRRRTYFGDVLVLLHVGDQSQTYTAYPRYGDSCVLFPNFYHLVAHSFTQVNLYRISARINVKVTDGPHLIVQLIKGGNA